VPEDLGCFRRHGGARGGAVVSVLFLGARERLERGEESGEQWERKSLSVRFILPLLMHCHAIGLHTCTTLRFPNRLAVCLCATARFQQLCARKKRNGLRGSDSLLQMFSFYNFSYSLQKIKGPQDSNRKPLRMKNRAQPTRHELRGSLKFCNF
jgi:hypothetical protein